MTTILTGTMRPSTETDAISFSHDLAPNTWMTIPTALVSTTESIDAGASGNAGHGRVRITLKEATSPEGKMMETLVPMLESALLALSRKVGPALQPRTATEASPACISCLEQCQLIVLTPNDPFAQITCMLGCAACP
jgi:hypothetical protein